MSGIDWNAAPPEPLADDNFEVALYADHGRVGWAIFPSEADAIEFHEHMNREAASP